MRTLFQVLARAGSRLFTATTALLLAAAATPSQAAYPPGIYALTLTGLPAGLVVIYKTRLLSCIDPLAFVPSGSVQMTERIVSSLEVVDTPTGPQQQVVERTVYDGTVRPSLPIPVGPCLGADGGNHDLEMSAEVYGRLNGKKITRTVFLLPRVMTGNNLHFTESVVAASTFGATTLPATQTGPITFTRNVLKQVVVDNLNTTGKANTRTPTLEITIPSQGRTLVSMSLASDGRPCLAVAGSIACQGDVPATPSGGFVVRGVELQSIEHRFTGADLPLNTSRAVFRFKLPSNFPVGTFELKAFANDVDPFPYTVNGVTTSLDLLPWRAAKHAVAVQ